MIRLIEPGALTFYAYLGLTILFLMLIACAINFVFEFVTYLWESACKWLAREDAKPPKPVEKPTVWQDVRDRDIR